MSRNGNQSLTRRYYIIDKNDPEPQYVNGISGDMLKHIQAEHLHRVAIESSLSLSEGGKKFDPDRICAGQGDRLLELERLFSQINYFGKRGCFFQYLPDQTRRSVEAEFQLTPEQGFMIQPMDDLGPKTTFNRINPFSTEKAQLEKDRVIKPGFLPLQLISTSARYDLYTRL